MGGDYCMPEGEVCPVSTVTWEEMPTDAGWETSVSPWMWSVPWLAGLLQCPSVEPPTLFVTWEWTRMDVECPVACWSPPVSQCGATDIVCDMGMDKDGC